MRFAGVVSSSGDSGTVSKFVLYQARMLVTRGTRSTIMGNFFYVLKIRNYSGVINTQLYCDSFHKKFVFFFGVKGGGDQSTVFFIFEKSSVLGVGWGVDKKFLFNF